MTERDCAAGDTCTGAYAPSGAERNDASPCFAVTPEDARNIRLKHFVAYVEGAATNATTGISTWPPRLKLDDLSPELDVPVVTPHWNKVLATTRSIPAFHSPNSYAWQRNPM